MLYNIEQRIFTEYIEKWKIEFKLSELCELNKKQKNH